MERRKAMDTAIRVRKGTNGNHWIVVLFFAFVSAFLIGTLGSSAANAAPRPGNFSRNAASAATAAIARTGINKVVYERLATLPWYGVFDNLQYQVRGSTVTLSGQVLFPLTRSSVENTVKNIPGVAHVVNHVTELSTSPFDNQIRWAEYRALFFGNSPLFDYSLGVNPGIHIIVDNSRVTLVGVVNNQADRNLAAIRAKLVPNVFSVTNHLRVA
jgi:hyperosmotically inducible protein